VQLSDLHPTVLNAVLGADAPDPGSGARDLFNVAARGGEPRIVISTYNGPSEGTGKHARKRNNPVLAHRIVPQVAAQDRRFKYIASNDGQRELYDFLADPGEMRNLIDEHPAEAKRLAAYIKHWLEIVPPYEPPSAEEKRPTAPAVLDALRGLGYID
jgi:arylsulfatase A-like enzyme